MFAVKPALTDAQAENAEAQAAVSDLEKFEAQHLR